MAEREDLEKDKFSGSYPDATTVRTSLASDDGTPVDSSNPLPIEIISPSDENGNVEVVLQDQVTEPIDALFAQSISNFTISADTTASSATSLNYDFAATAGHGIITGDEILLLDTVGDRALQAVVTNVVTNTITIDRPIDHIYPSASTLGRIVTTEMAVDGSSTPQIFTVRAGTTPIDFTRFILTMLDGTAMDDGKFGGLDSLDNGTVIRVVTEGNVRTLTHWRSNADLKDDMYDVTYSNKAPAGQFGLSSRWTFTKGEFVVDLDGSTGDYLEILVQDDLSGLADFEVKGQGRIFGE
ncbi:MAG: hypothetical protein KAS32_15590 [Candidatus Peribacteraceae bacterium]|nr:hypothetical protein [Candidatus Peribacteraceae bacterium]